VGTAPADEALGLDGTSAEVAILAAPTSYLELFAFASPSPGVRRPDAPGIAEVMVAVDDLAATTAELAALGHEVRDGAVVCPDGTPVILLEGGPLGLRHVLLRVPDPASSPLLSLAPDEPVALDAVAGGDGEVASPHDLGANHVCLDVEGIVGVRGSFGDGVRWHHPVTSSSGGIASVCYGTTVDGVLVELLENHTPEASLSRERLALLPD
jgi:hypothetical protein